MSESPKHLEFSSINHPAPGSPMAQAMAGHQFCRAVISTGNAGDLSKDDFDRLLYFACRMCAKTYLEDCEEWLASLREVETILYYDGPLLSIFKDWTGQLFLASLQDFEKDLFWCAPITESELAQVKADPYESEPSKRLDSGTAPTFFPVIWDAGGIRYSTDTDDWKTIDETDDVDCAENGH